MMKPMLISAILWLAAAYGYSSTDWPNEPAGSMMLSDFGFDTKSGSGWVPIYPTGGEIVADNTAPFSPSSVLKHTWRHDTYGNETQNTYGFPNGTREFYLGFWWKPSNPFYGWQGNDHQKFLLIEDDHTYLMMQSMRGCLGGCGPYQLSLGMDIARSDNRHIYTNAYGEGSCCFNNVSSPEITLGQWHRIEIYGKTSTTASSQDGTYRLWMDNQLVLNYNNVNFGNRTFSRLLLTSIWDHADPCMVNGQPCVDSHEYDHVHLSIPNGAVPPFVISTGSPLPSAQSGKPYTAYLKAEGGKAPYAWTVSAGSLLPGLTLNKAMGVISGLPTTSGKCDFTVKVLDSNVPAKEATKAFTIVASGTPIAITSAMNQVEANGIALAAKGTADRVDFNLRSANAGKFSVKVFDLQGRNVWSHATATGKGSAVEAVWNHGGKLKKGVYLVRVEQNGKSMTTNYCHVW